MHHRVNRTTKQRGAETTEVAASQVAIQVDEHGYEWKTETDGQKYYRTAGSEEDWVRYEG